MDRVGWQAAQKQLKEVRDRAAEREEHFEKELATAQKLSALYKTAADDSTVRWTELEGVVRELKEHVQVGAKGQEHAGDCDPWDRHWQCEECRLYL